jgi:hypothetical protein
MPDRVFLAYATGSGWLLMDAELYLPVSWTADPRRCAAAGVPAEVQFATKPQLARMMIERVVRAGLPFWWVAADEAYGDNPGLRRWLEGEGIRYVMAVSPRPPGHHPSTVRSTPTCWLPGRVCSGGGCPAATARRDHASTTSPIFPTQATQSTGWWCGGPRTTESWRSSGAAPRPAPPWPTWSGSSACVGRWKSASRQPKGRWARPLPGPLLPGLVPAHHPGHSRAQLADRHRRAAGPAKGEPAPDAAGTAPTDMPVNAEALISGEARSVDLGAGQERHRCRIKAWAASTPV